MKKIYETPEIEILFIDFEDVICESDETPLDPA